MSWPVEKLILLLGTLVDSRATTSVKMLLRSVANCGPAATTAGIAGVIGSPIEPTGSPCLPELNVYGDRSASFERDGVVSRGLRRIAPHISLCILIDDLPAYRLLTKLMSHSDSRRS